MALTRATLLSAAEAYLQDDAAMIGHADPGDLGTAIDRAIERYSQDRPREIVATASGDGSVFDFALPSAWVEGFSRLVRIEYPFPPATGQREPNVVFDGDAPNEPEEVQIVQATSSAKKLRFMSVTPASGTDNILIVYTGLHTVHASDSAQTTVRASDEKALALLVASIACEMVASKYAETKDAAYAVDAVDYRSRSSEYAARARQLLRQYLVHVGGDPEAQVPAASGLIDWDATLQGGGDRLFRSARLV